MSRLLAAAQTQPVPMGHPRAAEVSVLSADERLGLEVLTHGTLRFQPVAPAGVPLPLALKVDGRLVSVVVRAPSPAAVQQALAMALPDDVLLLPHVCGGALVATFVRAIERRPAPEVQLRGTDARQQVERASESRFVLRGQARGGSELLVRAGDSTFAVRVLTGAWPLDTAVRLREAVHEAVIVVLTAPATRGGEVTVTLVPRR